MTASLYRLSLVPALACSLAIPHLQAAEGDAPPPPDEEPQGWTRSAQLGGFFTSVATRNADESRDSAIAGSTEAISYLLSIDGRLDWRQDLHSVEQTAVLKFGRLKEEDRPWTENTDQIDYDGAYKYQLKKPSYMYGAWGLDTVFTGAEPDNEPFDPATAKISAGYGQKYTWSDPARKWDWRVGARAQRSWGRLLTEDDREIQTGIEFVTRWESKPREDLSYWLQYEAFSEFEDLNHITNLFTASLDYQLMKYLTLKLSLRAYYETEPDDAETDIGYDDLSLRQETWLGMTYTL